MVVYEFHFLFETLTFLILIFFVFLIISQILEYFHYMPNLLYLDRININNSYIFFNERPSEEELRSFAASKFNEAKSHFFSQPGLCNHCDTVLRSFDRFHPICRDIYTTYLEQYRIGTNERCFAQILFRHRNISTSGFVDRIIRDRYTYRSLIEDLFKS